MPYGKLKYLWLLIVVVVVLSLALPIGAGSCQPEEEAGPVKVGFTTEDGVPLRGYLFGQGKTGIVLAPMYASDQRSWHPLARLLAREGYQVLTFDFRGHGESGGRKDIPLLDRDARAALAALRGRGLSRLFLIGASLGGTASLMVAAREPVAGVVTLSAPVEFQGLSARGDLGRITVSKLIIASEGDRPAEASARELEAQSPAPKYLRILPGAAHGTDLLYGDQKEAVQKLLSDFLANPEGFRP